MLQVERYVRPGYADLKDLAAKVDLWDATVASWVSRCARYAEYSILYNLRSVEEGYARQAGKALHAALAAYYTGVDPDACLVILKDEWGHDVDWRLPPGHRYAHLHLGHLEVVFKNYMDFARKRDTFKPLLVRREDLKLDQVLGGIWQVTDDGYVVLGESKFFMEFELLDPKGGKPLLLQYAGRPDLPIAMGGLIYVNDWKTSSGYLSDWYFSQYKLSNQLRGYCKMLEALTGMELSGALITGIYVGEKAADLAFKGARFARFGPMSFRQQHLDEALLNQYFWKETLLHHHTQNYFPQNTGKPCQSCDYLKLCETDPRFRDQEIRTSYRVASDGVMDTFLKL